MGQLSKTRATTLGKFIALVLRHDPSAAGLVLCENGWADTAALVANTKQPMAFWELEEVVHNDSKTRYAFNGDYTKIRANQGHSVDVDVELVEAAPPLVLYHGTADRFVEAILREGLKPMSRQHVHLSADTETAAAVGKRHGKLVILKVLADTAVQDGQRFYRSANGVWLTGPLKPDYIELD